MRIRRAILVPLMTLSFGAGVAVPAAITLTATTPVAAAVTPFTYFHS